MGNYHLVLDEVVTLRGHRFRARIWRSRDSKPVAVLSQVDGSVPTHWYSSQLANLVVQGFLGYSEVPYVYEHSRRVDDDGPSWAEVRFKVVGPHLRPILYSPSYHNASPVTLGRMLGHPLEPAR